MNRVLDIYASLWFNLAKLIAYAILIPAAFFFGWVESTAFVSLLSIVALVESSGSAVVTAILREETNSGGESDGSQGSST